MILAETFYPTVVVDTESDQYKNLKSYGKRYIKSRVKRGPGKGKVYFTDRFGPSNGFKRIRVR